MKKKETKSFPVKRLVINGVLIAMYVVLGYLRIQIGNAYRINLAPFAIILCALAYGPVDGLIVGFLGEFLTQVLGPYGLTQTTLLWCVGETARGLMLGLLAKVFLRKLLTEKPTGYQVTMVIVCSILAGVLASLGNTLALYVDSKMLGYYSYALVFGSMLIRTIIHVVVSGLLGYLSLPILTALRKAKLL